MVLVVGRLKKRWHQKERGVTLSLFFVALSQTEIQQLCGGLPAIETIELDQSEFFRLNPERHRLLTVVSLNPPEAIGWDIVTRPGYNLTKKFDLSVI